MIKLYIGAVEAIRYKCVCIRESYIMREEGGSPSRALANSSRPGQARTACRERGDIANKLARGLALIYLPVVYPIYFTH